MQETSITREPLRNFSTRSCMKGRRCFYKGDVAKQIAAMDGCTIGIEDLARYRVERRQPLKSRCGAHDVYMNPPPAIGGALIDYTLGFLAQTGLTSQDFGTQAHIQGLISAMEASNQARTASGIDTDAFSGAVALEGMGMHPPAYRGDDTYQHHRCRRQPGGVDGF